MLDADATMPTSTTIRKRARRVSVVNYESDAYSSSSLPVSKKAKEELLSRDDISPVTVSTASVMANDTTVTTSSSFQTLDTLQPLNSSEVQSADSYCMIRGHPGVGTSGSTFHQSGSDDTSRAAPARLRPVVSPRSSTTSLSSLGVETVSGVTSNVNVIDKAQDSRTEEQSQHSWNQENPSLVLPRLDTVNDELARTLSSNGGGIYIRKGVLEWPRSRGSRVMVCLAAVCLLFFVTLPDAIMQDSTTHIAPNSKTAWSWRSSTSRRSIESNSVCVSGGGFSGFWYTLGRLESIGDRSSKNYYCYSAGCLGVVASLSNYSMEQMWNMAYSVQMKWKRGEITRYQVVEAFLDDLLYTKATNATTNDWNDSGTGQSAVPVLNKEALSSLNIITTVKSGWLGLAPSVRTPNSVDELRTMLIQTSWIPFAIGDDLWHDEHMDGAFTLPQHPGCEHHVGLSLDWDLYMNVVNVNLGRHKVEKFWNLGLTRGL